MSLSRKKLFLDGESFTNMNRSLERAVSEVCSNHYHYPNISNIS